MRPEEFRNILKKYRRGECTSEEEAMVEKWFRAMDNAKTDIPGQELDEIRQRSLLRIRRHVASGPRKYFLSRPVVWAAAATVSLILIASAVLFLGYPGSYRSPVSAETVLQTITNDDTAPREVRLADGSVVHLKPKSKISWHEPFPTDRQVWLEGEALFTVTKDKRRPFRVNTREVVTKVLGTRFLVSAFSEDVNITVEVMTGRVAVMTTPPSDGAAQETILTPNQKIVYNKEKQVASRALVSNPIPTVSQEVMRRMYFEEAPVREIFEGLEKVYAIDIVFDHAVFESCILTTSIGGSNLYNRLEMICKAIDAHYRVEENKIVIAGRGCHPGGSDVSR